jgi:hypothetical protein
MRGARSFPQKPIYHPFSHSSRATAGNATSRAIASVSCRLPRATNTKPRHWLGLSLGLDPGCLEGCLIPPRTGRQPRSLMSLEERAAAAFQTRFRFDALRLLPASSSTDLPETCLPRLTRPPSIGGYLPICAARAAQRMRVPLRMHLDNILSSSRANTYKLCTTVLQCAKYLSNLGCSCLNISETLYFRRVRQRIQEHGKDSPVYFHATVPYLAPAR